AGRASSEPADLRARWTHRAVHRHQADRSPRHRDRSALMRRQLLTGLLMTVCLTLLLGVGYPLVVTGISQAAFHQKANGSMVDSNGNSGGSSLIGQNFTAPNYFQPRPSAAGDGYDATKSGGSNLGPSNDTLINDDVAQRVTAYRQLNGLADDTPVP